MHSLRPHNSNVISKGIRKIRFLFHGGTREKSADGSIRNIGMAHNGRFILRRKMLPEIKKTVISCSSDKL
jgi:hypothetical protein